MWEQGQKSKVNSTSSLASKKKAPIKFVPKTPTKAPVKTKNFGSILFTVLLIGLGGFCKGFVKAGFTTTNGGPTGAIEYFESTDGKSNLALYKTYIHLETDSVFLANGRMTKVDIQISDIDSVQRSGSIIHIYTNDKSELTFDVGRIHLERAKGFQETLQNLMHK